MSTPLAPTDMFHVGIVVADLEVAQRHLSDTLGTRWGQVMEHDLPTRTGDGVERTVAMKVVYSIDAPHLELIQEVPETVWTCNPYSNLHHIGFFGGALTPTSEGLEASGCPLEISDWHAESAAPSTFAFHRNELGVRIEVVDTSLRDVLPMVWAEPQ